MSPSDSSFTHHYHPHHSLSLTVLLSFFFFFFFLLLPFAASFCPNMSSLPLYNNPSPFHFEFREIKETTSSSSRKKMMKLRSKRFCRSSTFRFGSFVGSCNNKIKVADDQHKDGGGGLTEIKWELRPGGMLVQRREIGGGSSLTGEETITIRVSTVSQWHDISVEPTSSFGELKMILSMVTGLEAREQRLLFKGKERDDCEYLHMVGVGDRDKVLLLEDPAIKERKKKLHGLTAGQPKPISV